MATKLRRDRAECPRKRNKFMLKALRIISKHIRAMINELRSFRQLELRVRQHGDENLESPPKSKVTIEIFYDEDPEIQKHRSDKSRKFCFHQIRPTKNYI